MHWFNSQMARETDWERMVVLCNAMLQWCGGLDGFVRAWGEAFEDARRRRPGGRVVMGALHALLRLTELCDRNRPPERDYRKMSDEELRERQRHGALEVKALRREVRNWEARAAGEEAPPPPDEDDDGDG
jgi:hypothetical protein